MGFIRALYGPYGLYKALKGPLKSLQEIPPSKRANALHGRVWPISGLTLKNRPRARGSQGFPGVSLFRVSLYTGAIKAKRRG